MEYTHTWELEVGGKELEGEVIFNHGNPPTIKVDTPIEMRLSELKQVQEMFEGLVGVCARCGEIQKMEIVKK